jgi:primosomal protein N' (replication factor Y)
MPPRRRIDSPPSFYQVAVLSALRAPLTYRVPKDVDLRPGQRVRVPLGTRQATGIALEPAGRVPPGIEIREIRAVLDPAPLLSPELITLGLWIADYYLAPVGEVFRAMLPLRAETRKVKRVSLTEAGRRALHDIASNLLPEIREGEQAAFLRYIAQPGAAGQGCTLDSLRRRFSGAGELMAHAVAKGWVTISEGEARRGQRKILAVRLRGPLPPHLPGLSPVARRIVEVLERTGAAEDHREILEAARAELSHLRKLEARGVVELTEAEGRLSSVEQAAATPLELNAEQAAAFEQLTQQLEARRFSPVLLHGVTGSGKTEVYLRLIARCLEQGRTALMLVPEIALTPAVEAQFVSRFGKGVAVLHSGLTETQRHESWWRARRGEAHVVLGTRSGIFAPLENLGLVIVDEEHDPSFKQMETPRYHARDVAVVRARLAQALVVLGSATPSLESYWNAQQKKYRLLTLPQRVAGRPLASVEIVDMRQEFRETHSQIPISRQLKSAIETQLQSGAQTMILLNRRGYSWFLLCRSCGETRRCAHCSISLTYHRREQRLICHYCGYSAPIPSHCPSCGSEYLHYVGEGTEKLEAKFAELFPGARVARLDRDVTQRPGVYHKLLSDFRQGKIDILVGTQLISKGHDFPGVTLVGVVTADLGLGMPDFRAAERTFQLLTQVAGRAGRGLAPGRVLVQTFFPEHYAIRLAADQNYEGFFSKELRFRRMMHYPPCGAIANVIVQDVKLEKAARAAGQMGAFLEGIAKESGTLKILGPGPAPLARLKRRYRIQFLLKAPSRAPLNDVLRRLADHCEQRGIRPQTVVIDVDPVSVM